LKAIELVAMNRDVAQSCELPGVALVNPHTDEVRHDVRQAVVVISFNPDDLNIAFGIRELADIAEKLPMVFGEAGKVKVGENVAEQDQALEAIFFQNAGGFAGVAGLCTEVQVGKDQRVVHGQIHPSRVVKECYEVMNNASKSVQW
jgi:hypothetical protein